MKIPPTKHDIPPTKYDVPLPFNKKNSTGQYFISCEDPFFIKGSLIKRQYYLLRQYIPEMDKLLESSKSSSLNLQALSSKLRLVQNEIQA